jgi:hypothetical protein
VAGKPEVRSVEATKRADILRLLQLTQAGAMGELAAQQIITTFRQLMPQVKDEIWQELKKEISAEELLLRLVPVYDKHFGAAEMKELIRFYESPIGKKTTQVMPAINQEAMQIGQQWGSEVSVRIKRRIDAAARPRQPPPRQIHQPKEVAPALTYRWRVLAGRGRDRLLSQLPLLHYRGGKARGPDRS